MNLAVLLIASPILLLIEGLYSGAEIALLSADRLKLKANSKTSHGARLALDLVTHPERLFSTTLFVTNLCIVALSALIAVYLIAKEYPNAELLSIAITSPLVVLFGELIPKAIYQRYADRIAPIVAYPIQWAFWIFYPATRLLRLYTSRLSRVIGPMEELWTGTRRSTREELRAMLSYGRRESEIKASEKRMIKRIFDFKDTEAKHALIPLVKVDAIAEGSRLREALDSFQRHRHSRMPVFLNRIDNIVGIIEVSDLLSATDLDQPIRPFIRPAHYAAETQALEDLVREMRTLNTEMSVVVDEYGGAMGVLTFEDIVEEIVGEISDEFDTDSATYKHLSPTSWLVPARLEVVQINEQLELALPEGDYETLGGFLLQQFGRIPEERDELYFDTQSGSLKFTVKKATKRAIQAVMIERLAPPKTQSND